MSEVQQLDHTEYTEYMGSLDQKEIFWRPQWKQE